MELGGGGQDTCGCPVPSRASVSPGCCAGRGCCRLSLALGDAAAPQVLPEPPSPPQAPKAPGDPHSPAALGATALGAGTAATNPRVPQKSPDPSCSQASLGIPRRWGPEEPHPIGAASPGAHSHANPTLSRASTPAGAGWPRWGRILRTLSPFPSFFGALLALPQEEPTQGWDVWPLLAQRPGAELTAAKQLLNRSMETFIRLPLPIAVGSPPGR